MMKKLNRLIALGIASTLALPALPALAAAAALCEKHSPSHTVALLELYTSEGCDSCPPADRFVRGLYGAGFTADQVVPLSLHVDYWDSLGWKDRFASPQFTRRQYWLAGPQASGVYTPEIFLGGREARNWRGGEFQKTVESINARPARAAIVLSETPAPSGQVAIKATASVGGAERGAPLGLYLAFYESELVSEVKAGENRGATLRHGFVVRRWEEPVRLDESGAASITWQEPLGTDVDRHNLGYVAFVGNTATGEVLQAVALPDCSTAGGGP